MNVLHDEKRVWNAGGWGARGGGTRGREGGGGKWAGLDPVVPVTTPELLNSVASFYGCAAFHLIGNSSSSCSSLCFGCRPSCN